MKPMGALELAAARQNFLAREFGHEWERRSLPTCKFRQLVDNKNRIEGYAAVYDSLSENLGNFRERIERGAFDRDLKANKDIRAFFDHDSGCVLGRVSAGSLRLWSDDVGLGVSIDLPEPTEPANLRFLMDRGDIDQMSFGFYVRSGGEKDGGRSPDGLPVRVITDVELVEVSVVSIPAYSSTSCYLRSKTFFQLAGDLERRERLVSILSLRRRAGLYLPGR